MSRTRDWPTPTTPKPSVEQIGDWIMDVEYCEATDGCDPVDPDGYCEHGYPSWLLQMGLI